MKGTQTPVRRTRIRWWHLPAFTVALGGVCAAAIWIGGDGAGALGALAIMGLLAAGLVLGGRSELVRGLRGDGRDEYWARLDLLASLFAGYVAITAIIAMCLWEWAHGRDGTPYAQLGALAGVAYLAAVAFLRLRG